MKNISTGFGLCVAAAVLVYPFVSNLSPSANAFSGREQRSLSDLDQIDQAISLANSNRLAESDPGLQSFVTPCAELSYFASDPRFFGAGCGPLATIPLSPADVNADGTPELWSGTTVVPVQGCPWGLIGDQWPILTLSGLQLSPAGPIPTATLVARLTSPAVGSLMAMMPQAIQTCGSAGCCGSVGEWILIVSTMGWLDCDGDGDLDLVLSAERQEKRGGICTNLGCIQTPGYMSFGSLPFWLENTGYQRPSVPLSADLNLDGRVDGADLGLLLFAWGPVN